MGTNIIEIELSRKLKEKNPALDLYGADRRLLQIACQDLVNYLKVWWGLAGRELGDVETVMKLEWLIVNEPEEFEEFIDLWAGIWLKKWGERVRLQIGESKLWARMEKKLGEAKPFWKKLPNKREMTEAVVYALVKNGEICGTRMLAENLLKLELTKGKRTAAEIVSDAMAKARRLARTSGPLLIIKVDKGFFNI